MAARKTRQKIKDHIASAITHLENAVQQINNAMEMGEDRSSECYYLMPKGIEYILACKEFIESIQTKL